MWLSAWLASLELEVDVPLPEGVADPTAPSSTSGLAAEAFLQYAWQVATTNKTSLNVSRTEQDGVVVRQGWQPALPVFTCEWEQTVEGATVETFIDMNLKSMAEQAAQWDTTFLGAEYLADHGSPDDLSRFARLVRWRFRAAPGGRIPRRQEN